MLDIGDVHSSLGILQIRHGKGGKVRLLPLDEPTTGWLQRYLKESRSLLEASPSEPALFLTGYGQRFSVSGLGNLVRQLLDAAGIHVSGSCHLFRHTCATRMLEGGADIRIIQQLLGHARLDTTAIYAEVSIEHLKEVHARCHPHGGPATGDHRNCDLPLASNPC